MLPAHSAKISARSRSFMGFSRVSGFLVRINHHDQDHNVNGSTPLLKDILYRQRVIYQQYIEKNHLFSTQILRNKTISRYKSVAIMIEKWVNFKRDYLEKSFLRENCGYDGSDNHRR